MSRLKFSLSRDSDFEPDRNWRLLFGGFLILAIFSFAAAIYLYRVLDSLELVSQERMIANPSSRLNRESLDEVAKELAEKQNRFDAFLGAPPSIVDPTR